ncbi:MAG TPA: AAA family ATPase, partial [Thermoanaerobaculia bacterium]|nr:AAA family ATPase [Thermoanaerobaculia bacterium]
MIAWKGGELSSSGRRTGLCKNFGRLIAYLTRGSGEALNPDRVAWISCRNLDGIDDPARVAQVMRAHAGENPRTEKPVYHFGLSLHPGEHLSHEQWNQALDRVLERLGLARHQALIVAHRDTNHEHVHVVVNRVGDSGRAWNKEWDLVKAYEAIRRIEVEFGLIRNGARGLPGSDLTSGAYQQALRTGRQPLPDRVREQAGTAFAEATDWSDLEARLAARGFRLEPAPRPSGLLVTDGPQFASLSRVDRSLSGPQLALRFGETFLEHRAAHPEPPTVLAPGRAFCPRPVEDLRHRAAELLERLAETRATFTAADLHRAAFYQPESVALVREALRDDRVLDLGKDAAGASRYTTRDYLDAEARLLAAAARLASRHHSRLDTAAQAQDPAAQARHPTAWQRDPAAQQARGPATGELAEPGLAAEQRAAVVHATAETTLAQIVGGDAKARAEVARAIAADCQDRGYQVFGAALTAKGAANLETAAGVQARTLASLERAWSEGADRLHPRAVLLLDEAGLLDVRRLGRILADAGERHAKVVLLGDPDRLQAIAAGDAFRGLLERFPSACLDPASHRDPLAHLDPAGRRGPVARLAPAGRHDPMGRPDPLDRGGVASVLDRCEAAGLLHWADSHDAARAELLGAYARDRSADPGGSQLVLAHGRAEAEQLNQSIRAERRAAGELGPEVRAGGIQLARGDRVVFRRDDPQGRTVVSLDATPERGVRSGALGTVVAAEPHRLAVRLDDGRSVAFDPTQYRAVAHGYALAVRGWQGAAADRVYVLADPAMDRHAASLALTRHRDGIDLFADRATFPGRDDLDRALSRAGHKDLAGDYAAAELRRAADRLQDLVAKTNQVMVEQERPLRDALAAHSSLCRERLRVVEARRSIAEAAARVYVDPAKALHSLLRDPQAPARLRRGEASEFGRLQGRALLGVAGAERAKAVHGVMSLTGRLD